MDYRTILARIRATVRRGSYLVPVASDPWHVLAEIATEITDPDADPDVTRQRIHQLHASGRIDRVMKLSALGVLAASPSVRDYAEAARLAGQQELVALDTGGPRLMVYLASADRHRGVLAYLMGQYEVALDWFTRALERQTSAENLGNVLSTLIRLGELDEARDLAARAESRVPEAMSRTLQTLIETDDDLSGLR